MSVGQAAQLVCVYKPSHRIPLYCTEDLADASRLSTQSVCPLPSPKSARTECTNILQPRSQSRQSAVRASVMAQTENHKSSMEGSSDELSSLSTPSLHQLSLFPSEERKSFFAFDCKGSHTTFNPSVSAPAPAAEYTRRNNCLDTQSTKAMKDSSRPCGLRILPKKNDKNACYTNEIRKDILSEKISTVTSVETYSPSMSDYHTLQREFFVSPRMTSLRHRTTSFETPLGMPRHACQNGNQPISLQESQAGSSRDGQFYSYQDSNIQIMSPRKPVDNLSGDSRMRSLEKVKNPLNKESFSHPRNRKSACVTNYRIQEVRGTVNSFQRVNAKLGEQLPSRSHKRAVFSKKEGYSTQDAGCNFIRRYSRRQISGKINSCRNMTCTNGLAIDMHSSRLKSGYKTFSPRPLSSCFGRRTHTSSPGYYTEDSSVPESEHPTCIKVLFKNAILSNGKPCVRHTGFNFKDSFCMYPNSTNVIETQCTCGDGDCLVHPIMSSMLLSTPTTPPNQKIRGVQQNTGSDLDDVPSYQNLNGLSSAEVKPISSLIEQKKEVRSEWLLRVTRSNHAHLFQVIPLNARNPCPSGIAPTETAINPSSTNHHITHSEQTSQYPLVLRRKSTTLFQKKSKQSISDGHFHLHNKNTLSVFLNTNLCHPSYKRSSVYAQHPRTSFTICYKCSTSHTHHINIFLPNRVTYQQQNCLTLYCSPVSNICLQSKPHQSRRRNTKTLHNIRSVKRLNAKGVPIWCQSRKYHNTEKPLNNTPFNEESKKEKKAITENDGLNHHAIGHPLAACRMTNASSRLQNPPRSSLLDHDKQKERLHDSKYIDSKAQEENLKISAKRTLPKDSRGFSDTICYSSRHREHSFKSQATCNHSNPSDLDSHHNQPIDGVYGGRWGNRSRNMASIYSNSAHRRVNAISGTHSDAAVELRTNPKKCISVGHMSEHFSDLVADSQVSDEHRSPGNFRNSYQSGEMPILTFNSYTEAHNKLHWLIRLYKYWWNHSCKCYTDYESENKCCQQSSCSITKNCGSEKSQKITNKSTNTKYWALSFCFNRLKWAFHSRWCRGSYKRTKFYQKCHHETQTNTNLSNQWIDLIDWKFSRLQFTMSSVEQHYKELIQRSYLRKLRLIGIIVVVLSVIRFLALGGFILNTLGKGSSIYEGVSSSDTAKWSSSSASPFTHGTLLPQALSCSETAAVENGAISDIVMEREEWGLFVGGMIQLLIGCLVGMLGMVGPFLLFELDQWPEAFLIFAAIINVTTEFVGLGTAMYSYKTSEGFPVILPNISQAQLVQIAPFVKVFYGLESVVRSNPINISTNPIKFPLDSTIIPMNSTTTFVVFLYVSKVIKRAIVESITEWFLLSIWLWILIIDFIIPVRACISSFVHLLFSIYLVTVGGFMFLIPDHTGYKNRLSLPVYPQIATILASVGILVLTYMVNLMLEIDSRKFFWQSTYQKVQLHPAAILENRLTDGEADSRLEATSPEGGQQPNNSAMRCFRVSSDDRCNNRLPAYPILELLSLVQESDRIAKNFKKEAIKKYAASGIALNAVDQLQANARRMLRIITRADGFYSPGGLRLPSQDLDQSARQYLEFFTGTPQNYYGRIHDLQLTTHSNDEDLTQQPTLHQSFGLRASSNQTSNRNVQNSKDNCCARRQHNVLDRFASRSSTITTINDNNPSPRERQGRRGSARASALYRRSVTDHFPVSKKDVPRPSLTWSSSRDSIREIWSERLLNSSDAVLLSSFCTSGGDKVSRLSHSLGGNKTKGHQDANMWKTRKPDETISVAASKFKPSEGENQNVLEKMTIISKSSDISIDSVRTEDVLPPGTGSTSKSDTLKTADALVEELCPGVVRFESQDDTSPSTMIRFNAEDPLCQGFVRFDTSTPSLADNLRPDLEKNVGAEWNFNVLELSGRSNNVFMEVGYALLNTYCCRQHINGVSSSTMDNSYDTTPSNVSNPNDTLGVSAQTVLNFLYAIQCLYQFTPYHNQLHGAMVGHTMAFLCGHLKLFETAGCRETATIITAALCHDVGHPGRNNLFFVNTYDQLAIIYNDTSVLENFHAYTTFKTLDREDCDIFQNLTEAEFRLSRQQIIELILATDMKHHFETITRLKVRTSSPDFNPLQTTEDRSLILRMCMKLADLSHATLRWDQHYEWSCRITEEFYAQGDEEMELQLTQSPLCDRSKHKEMAKSQVGFLNFVIKPLVVEMANLDTSGSLSTLKRQLQANSDQWDEFAVKTAVNGRLMVWPERLQIMVRELEKRKRLLQQTDGNRHNGLPRASEFEPPSNESPGSKTRKDRALIFPVLVDSSFSVEHPIQDRDDEVKSVEAMEEFEETMTRNLTKVLQPNIFRKESGNDYASTQKFYKHPIYTTHYQPPDPPNADGSRTLIRSREMAQPIQNVLQRNEHDISINDSSPLSFHLSKVPRKDKKQTASISPMSLFGKIIEPLSFAQSISTVDHMAGNLVPSSLMGLNDTKVQEDVSQNIDVKHCGQLTSPEIRASFLMSEPRMVKISDHSGGTPSRSGIRRSAGTATRNSLKNNGSARFLDESTDSIRDMIDMVTLAPSSSIFLDDPDSSDPQSSSPSPESNSLKTADAQRPSGPYTLLNRMVQYCRRPGARRAPNNTKSL